MEEHMITILYDPVGGFAVPDGAARQWAKNVAKSSSGPKEYDFFFHIGTEAMLNSIRLLVVLGEINHKDVVVEFKGEKYELNQFSVTGQDGHFEWPRGLAEEGIDIVEDLVKAQMDLRFKKEKQK
jgi:hypothetical protein